MTEPQTLPTAAPTGRRAALIEATMSAIREHGFSNLTLAKIAGIAGLTAGTVNFHFDSKQALLLATLKQVAEEFECHIDDAVSAAEDEPAAQLSALLEASLDPLLTEPRKVAMWYAFMSEAGARDDYLRICGARDARFHERIVALCGRLIDARDPPDRPNAEAIGLALCGLIDGLWQEVLFAADDFDRDAARAKVRSFLASVFPWCFEMPAAASTAAERVTADGGDGLVLTLPSWTYRSPGFFALEMEQIFRPAWHVVCHQSDLPAPGAWATFELLSDRALVIRNASGRIRAFHNVCRHRAHLLADGALGACPGRLTCPYHGWTYDLDGRRIALGAPDSFAPHDPEAFGLVPLDCEVYLGFVFVRFRGPGPSVAEQFAPVAEEFADYRTEEMVTVGDWSGHFWVEDMAVDWKNATENYLEDYHFATGHKGLAGLMEPAYDREPHPGLARLSHLMRDRPRGGWSNVHYRAVLPTYGHLPEHARHRWTYYAMYPATFFDLFPERMDFMQMLPLGPGRMRLRGRSYALPDDSRRTRAARYLSNRINVRVQREDNRLTREVQRGLASSAYEYGILSDKEILVRHFQDWVRERLPVATLRREPSDLDSANRALTR